MATQTQNRKQTADPVRKVKVYCKRKLGFVPLVGRKAVAMKAYFGLREELGAAIQSQSYTLGDGRKNPFDWRDWNANQFDKLIGGSPMDASAEDLASIETNMARLANMVLAPEYDKDVKICLGQLAKTNQESMKARARSRQESATFQSALQPLLDATSSQGVLDDELDDEELDEDEDYGNPPAIMNDGDDDDDDEGDVEPAEASTGDDEDDLDDE